MWELWQTGRSLRLCRCMGNRWTMLHRWDWSDSRRLTRLCATMNLDTLQRGQFQAQLWRALILLSELILRKDARTFGQFLKFKKLRELLNLAHFIFSQVKN